MNPVLVDSRPCTTAQSPRHTAATGAALSSVAHRPSDPSSFQSSQTYLSASAADTLNTGRGGAILPASACPLTREGPELPKRLLRLS